MYKKHKLFDNSFSYHNFSNCVDKAYDAQEVQHVCSNIPTTSMCTSTLEQTVMPQNLQPTCNREP